MAKRKCKNGKCSLIGRPKTQAPGPIAQARQTGIQGITQQLAPAPSKKNKGAIPQNRVHIPGFPKEVTHTPTAAAQYYANQLENAALNPVTALPQPSTTPITPTIQNLNQGLQQQDEEVGDLLNAVNTLTPEQKQQFFANNPDILPLTQPTTGYGQYSNQFPGAQPWSFPSMAQQNSLDQLAAGNMSSPQQQAKKKNFLAKAWSWLSPFGLGKKIYKAAGGGRATTSPTGAAGIPQVQYDASGAPIPTPGTTNQTGPQVLSPSGQQPGWFEKALTGGYPEAYKASIYTPYQQAAQNYITYNALNRLGGGGFDFGPIANQQLEQFYGNTVPTLAERFTAMGNGQRSSAFQGALAQAGRGLSNDLAAQQQLYNLQQQGHYANLLNYGLRPQFENAIQPGSPGFLQAAVPAATPALKALI